MRIHATVGEDGRYELLLGPGEYRLQGPARVEPVKLIIPAESPPAEIVQNFEMPRSEVSKLTVTVVDGDDKPVAGVMLDGAYQAMQAHFNPIRTNDQGTVQIQHWLDPLVLSAANSDRSQAAVVRLDADATAVQIVLKPTATASGRLVDPEGKPIPGRKMAYGVRVLLRGPDKPPSMKSSEPEIPGNFGSLPVIGWGFVRAPWFHQANSLTCVVSV